MTPDEASRCACGRELHYTDPDIRQHMAELIADLGETVTVTTPAGSWRVPRHYIALHGLKAAELPELAQSLGFHKAGPIP